MPEERFQRGPDYPWKRERGSNEYCPLLSKKESPYRIIQTDSPRSRFMGCHDRSFKTDLLILSSDLKIERVMAKERLMVHEDEILVKGTFED